MAVMHLISVEEYLHTSYEYDAEYVEGRIVYRNMPKKPHSRMQRFLLTQLCRPGKFQVWPEQRIRTKENPARFRVPDLCVTLGEPDEDVFTEPPFLCIEILSPDDRAVDVLAKVEEYLEFGVAYVWLVEPVSLTGEIHTAAGIEKVRDGKFRSGEIEIDLGPLRAALA